MLVSNKISRTLEGPYRFIGYYFAVGGIMAGLHMSWIIFGIHVFIGWFLLGSYSGVEINTGKQQYRSFNMWFGIIKTGKWEPVSRYRGLTLVSMQEVDRLYSRSNRSTSSHRKLFSVYFVNQKKRPAIAIKKCKTNDEAQKCMDELAIWLHLPVYSATH
ncbi:hypothetical protein [uncultured Draconibacterium sp.]|uniref:hypothetical protein n=1 Tax=uncultured Draconibacterium sp. TaxID=1573823 RepID=UPI0025DAEB7D|nr:hypothetical protein [uncultured Draconibacterium sp.]